MLQAISMIASYDNVAPRQALAGALEAELIASKKRFEADWGKKIKPSELKPSDVKITPLLRRLLAVVRNITGIREDGAIITKAVQNYYAMPKAERDAALEPWKTRTGKLAVRNLPA